MVEQARFAPWVSEEAQARFLVESTRAAAPAGDVAAMRAHYDAFNREHLAAALAAYPVDIAEQSIAGVRVAIVSPPGVVGERTLLCLHGGAFMWGRGAGRPARGGSGGGD